MPRDYFAVLAQHSAWANRRLFEACAGLSQAAYMREGSSSFGSLHAILNHILVVDRIWIARIEGRTPPSLNENQILYADLVALKVARLAEDEHLQQLVAGLTNAAIELPLYYTDRRGNRFDTPLHLIFMHLFDAQSRCRGEALGLLAQAGALTPPIDFIAFVRETGAERRG